MSKDNYYIYRIKTENGFKYYAASDAIMAMVMSHEDGNKENYVEAVCTEDEDILEFIALKKYVTM